MRLNRALPCRVLIDYGAFSMSTVSAIIPAYNAEAFIREAIDSALAQTVPPLEILVVDDGSTDRTTSIVAAYPPPVRLLSRSNAGPAHARNTGAAHAIGDWLGFLDADDVWLPEKLERQLQRAAATGAPFVCCDRLNIGALDGLPVVHGELQPIIEGDVFERLLLGNVVGTSGVLVSR
jgi:glycosyltransferase involved in cell wall biosynthesis